MNGSVGGVNMQLSFTINMLLEVHSITFGRDSMASTALLDVLFRRRMFASKLVDFMWLIECRKSAIMA